MCSHALSIVGALIFQSLIISILLQSVVSATVTNMSCSAPSALIASGIDALGGAQALSKLLGVTFEVPSLYRTQTIMESYSLNGTETSIVTAGSQTVSFSYTNASMQQRIDTFGQLAAWMDFGRLNLDPLNYSLLIQDGSDGYACFVRGNNLVYYPADLTTGYTDDVLAEYLIHQAYQMSPKLLASFNPNEASSAYITIPNSEPLPSVFDPALNLSIIFDPNTNLPYIIRSFEDHKIFGPSTSDLMVYNYTSVAGVMFPRRFKTVYNDIHLLADFLVDSIDVNPSFPAGFFNGLPVDQSLTPPTAPKISSEYGHAEIGEYSANALYSGQYTGTLANLSATNPVSSLPNLWALTFKDSPGYSQLVMEFQEAIIVVDAPPHQSHLVIQWVQEKFERNVTHIWVTHHHHDHSYGVSDYIGVGAKMIVLQKAQKYWSSIPGIRFLTYTAERPFIHKDANLQVRFLDLEDTVHAEDQSYAFVSASCPAPNDPVVAFQADYWNPPTADFKFDQNQALVFYNKAAMDGISRTSIMIPAHGAPTPFQELIDVIGFPYPNHTATSFNNGGPLC